MILFRQGRQAEGDAGQADPLPLSQNPAHHDPTGHVRVGHLLHLQLQKPVVQKEPIARPNILGQVGVGGCDLVFVAVHLTGGQGEALALPQHRRAAGDGPHPQPRPLQILEHGYLLALLMSQATDEGQASSVGVVVAVREVEAGHVHPGSDHLPHDLLGFRGWAEGADDLGARHGHSPLLTKFRQRARLDLAFHGHHAAKATGLISRVRGPQ